MAISTIGIADPLNRVKRAFMPLLILLIGATSVAGVSTLAVHKRIELTAPVRARPIPCPSLGSVSAELARGRRYLTLGQQADDWHETRERRRQRSRTLAIRPPWLGLLSNAVILVRKPARIEVLHTTTVSTCGWRLQS